MIMQVVRAAIIAFRFLSEVVLGILAAILYALPWALRVAVVLGWLIATFILTTTLRAIYSPFTDTVPMLALEYFAVLLALAWAKTGLRKGNRFWGVLAAGALTMWGLARGMVWLLDYWQYAVLFFLVLPPALLAVGMIFISIRARTRRMLMSEATQS